MRATYHISALSCIFLWMLTLGMLTSCSDSLLDGEGGYDPTVTSPFEWTRSSDRATYYAFLRNYGVGYSYNAVDGEYCNWNDIRCQVINRDVVERLYTSLQIMLYGKRAFEMAEQNCQYTYNKRDYVAGIHLNSDTEVDLGLYNKTKRTRQDVLEDGVQEKFYYSVERTYTKGTQWIQEAEILSYVSQGKFETLLTESFRNAVKHIQQAVYQERHDEQYLEAVVDSFIKVYGTHVIVQATLGGKVRLDLTRNSWRYNDLVSEKEWTMEQILLAYSQRTESRKDSIYRFIENSSIYVTAYGGDQTFLKDFLGKTQYDGSRTFSMVPLEEWQKSLTLDLDDEKKSNVELIDMKVVPIWNFIAALDPMGEVAERVKAEITQDISYQQSQLGANNIFNTYFPVRYDHPQVKVRNEKGDYAVLRWDDLKGDDTLVPSDTEPWIHIVSGGKYVALMGKESINHVLYTTIYPIYDGKASLNGGIAIQGNQAYHLAWSYVNKGYQLTPMSKEIYSQTDTIYVNEGGLSLTRQPELTYADAHPMLYVETTGGVQPDGTFKMGNIFVPVKQDLDFIIPKAPQDKNPALLIGWDWNADTQQAVRNSSYTYIYNPTEMDYVE